jgi:hypothetical protein
VSTLAKSKEQQAAVQRETGTRWLPAQSHVSSLAPRGNHMVAGTTSCVPCVTRRRKHLPACYTPGTTAPVPIACSTGGLHCTSRLCLLTSRDLRTCPHRLRGPPSACKMVPRVFPEGKTAEAWCWPPTPT